MQALYSYEVGIDGQNLHEASYEKIWKLPCSGMNDVYFAPVGRLRENWNGCRGRTNIHE